MIFEHPPAPRSALRLAISAAFLADESACVEDCLAVANMDVATRERLHALAYELVSAVRGRQREHSGLDAFLHEYDLSSQEGVVLMCLAEALLRIPDTDTADRLIRDKLAKGQWDQHLGQSHSLFVNASTWGLMLTGGMVRLDPEAVQDISGFLGRLLARSGEPVIRLALKQAMRILGQQFVMGRTIDEALKRSGEESHHEYRHSFDMLGEAALTAADAQRYFDAYVHAVNAVAEQAAGAESVFAAPSVSVKLSALHPRYEYAQREPVMTELTPRLLDLASLARAAGIGLTIDAEEADRLELSLDVFAQVFRDHALDVWEGLGLAVQAYQKRAPAVLDWLMDLARSQGKRIPVRLVKGAYWDTEIKRAQQAGLEAYPVYTRKAGTDVSYLACALKIFGARDALYPQFATHNAQTLAAVVELAGKRRDFEFQRLHGMGEALYAEVLKHADINVPCRVYAPVGNHEDLLPYLVRRLLENGANTSFVNRLEDERAPIDDVIADPVTHLSALQIKPHPHIPLPIELYPERRNSSGLNLADEPTLIALAAKLEHALRLPITATPLVDGQAVGEHTMTITDPTDRHRVVGTVARTDAATLTRALTTAAKAAAHWDSLPAGGRAEILERAAELLEEHRSELMALCVREAGKTLADALGEVREAADFCRYYAMQARALFASPTVNDGATGEHNELQRHGRGVFACISPWNFPLAIFIGQISAALAAGNAVIAKPAGQTPLIAFRAVQLLHEAGVPKEVLHFTPGPGGVIGAALAQDPRISGIAFTGSTETARQINLALASRAGPIVPFIAETGGQNAMIVDSSALPEQVVKDVLRSAFNSAGQRCSALRVLFVQEEVADSILAMLTGAMAELRVGDPGLLATDVGPVIDNAARETLRAHIERLRATGRLIAAAPMDEKKLINGHFFAPQLYEIDSFKVLEHEVFGPVLHVIRYQSRRLDEVIEAVNGTGYGLTLGIHSRVDATARYIQRRIKAGNCYVNRDMIGAVVGIQPFGGEGLSGTGPKAGGPDYLLRFAVERTLSINTSAVGGNTSLLSLDER